MHFSCIRFVIHAVGTKTHAVIPLISLEFRVVSLSCGCTAHNDSAQNPYLHWQGSFLIPSIVILTILVLKITSVRPRLRPTFCHFGHGKALSTISDVQFMHERVISTLTLLTGYVSVPSDSHRSRGDSALHIQSVLQPSGGHPFTPRQTQSLQLRLVQCFRSGVFVHLCVHFSACVH